MAKTKHKNPQPVSGTTTGSAPAPTTRLILKCRCGGLYLNPDAHHDSFGHHPEPVAA